MEKVLSLLDTGALVNAKTYKKDEKDRTMRSTALHEASAAGHKAVVQLLLERGADIRIRDSEGRTALRLARLHNQPAVVKHLKSYAYTDKTKTDCFASLSLSLSSDINDRGMYRDRTGGAVCGSIRAHMNMMHITNGLAGMGW